ncbi:corrinoid adenosyltransferase [Nilaparvata lugens]|uniref:corrinoid adenosyltransferase n=1 Tax=Nilaparvata lugens TaxID=108931 RepID=UPI00193C8EAA|nr:corrinoid adenosyltransferase [Nilaparvata lugens]
MRLVRLVKTLRLTGIEANNLFSRASSSEKCIENCQESLYYSRKGDSGNTTLINSEKELPKDDKIFEAIGATDELSSHLGFAKEYGGQQIYGAKLRRIQIMLVDIVSAIHNCHATDSDQLKFSSQNTKELEEWIDEYSSQLTPFEPNILPGGGLASSSLHIARAVCRRAERSIIPLVREGNLDREILAYLNRLSDFLFTISRVACKTDERSEHVYSSNMKK